MSADFAAAAVLITYGAVLGKTSPLQLIVIAFIEIVFFLINESLGLVVFKVSIMTTTTMLLLLLLLLTTTTMMIINLRGSKGGGVEEERQKNTETWVVRLGWVDYLTFQTIS